MFECFFLAYKFVVLRMSETGAVAGMRLKEIRVCEFNAREIAVQVYRPKIGFRGSVSFSRFCNFDFTL